MPKQNIPNDAYQCATAVAALTAKANADAESLNGVIKDLMATAKDLGYDMAESYDWDPETFLPIRGTGLTLKI